MEYGIIVIIVIVVIFLIGRELFCWYYKINERIELQKNANDLQTNTNILLEKLIQLNGDSKLNSSNINNNDVIGNIIKLDNLEVTEKDFPHTLNWVEAKKECEKLGSGWRLPTKDELNILFQNKDKIGVFANISYWSSTEDELNKMWVQSFSSGKQFPADASNPVYVRAVRVIKN
jgi:hypothetical protein